jgi:hypothetical protein
VDGFEFIPSTISMREEEDTASLAKEKEVFNDSKMNGIEKEQKVHIYIYIYICFFFNYYL